jgi:hypothetical protein
MTYASEIVQSHKINPASYPHEPPIEVGNFT